MKKSSFLGGAVLGALIGGGIGYLIANDPEKRVQRYLRDKIGNTACGCGCDCNDEVLDEAIIDSIVEAEMDQQVHEKHKH
jgi:hypothetical protein